MANNMTDEQIEKIAQGIAAKIGGPGGPAILGCGDASSSQNYSCDDGYECKNYYECGGAGRFDCPNTTRVFNCDDDFNCYSRFTCGNQYVFNCYGKYNS